MPQIVPLLVPKLRPAGKVALIAHEVIVPEPVKVALSGKSLLYLLQAAFTLLVYPVVVLIRIAIFLNLHLIC